MILLFLTTAMAASFGVGPSYQQTINDPFVVARGVGATLAVQPLSRAPWLGLSLSGYLDPDLGHASWSELTRKLVDDMQVAPDLSPIRQHGELRLELTPFRQDLGAWKASAGGQVGLGLFHTEDDLELIGVTPSEAPAGTVSEWHPAPVYGLQAGIQRGSWQGRLLLERAPYEEHVLDVSERRGNWWAGTEVVLWR